MGQSNSKQQQLHLDGYRVGVEGNNFIVSVTANKKRIGKIEEIGIIFEDEESEWIVIDTEKSLDRKTLEAIHKAHESVRKVEEFVSSIVEVDEPICTYCLQGCSLYEIQDADTEGITYDSHVIGDEVKICPLQKSYELTMPSYHNCCDSCRHPKTISI
jgi:hypothetical protein